MTQVRILRQAEPVRVDGARLEALCRTMGPVAADALLARAVEELAMALVHADDLFARGEGARLHRTMADVAGMADQVGLTAMARIAGDVQACIASGDDTALVATLSRLIRVGERSLGAVREVRGRGA